MRSLPPLAALALACAPTVPPQRAGDQPTQVVSGPGFAVRVPDRARVDIEPNAVRVDSDDGRRWFDLRRLPHEAQPYGKSPDAVAATWAETMCAPMQWDDPVQTQAGPWVTGGMCFIERRPHWTIFVLVSHPDGDTLIAYQADRMKVSFEDAWVEFARTAATVTPGPEPAPEGDAEALRKLVREAVADTPPSYSQMPGGGLMSGRVTRVMPEVWERLAALPKPPAFGD